MQEVPQRGVMRDPVVPDDCPQEVADIIAACMQRDTYARPAAKEVCRWVPTSRQPAAAPLTHHVSACYHQLPSLCQCQLTSA
jgi:hypothetical protein